MNRRELILSILAAAEGRPFSPVQLQKAAFLIDRNLPGVVTSGPPFHFVPYDYGPFDKEVYNEALHLASSGRAVIMPSGAGRWNNYGVTSTGLSEGNHLLNLLPEDSRDFFRRVANWVLSQSFGSLVRSIYEAYPEMKVNSVFQG